MKGTCAFTVPATGLAARRGERGMSETQTPLGKIAALRQRLEQTPKLTNEAGSSPGAQAGGDRGRLDLLRRKVEAGAEHHALVDTALRQLTADAAPAKTLPA